MTQVKTFFAGGLVISTHTLTWSVTPIADCEACEVADFNSHAHVERDEYFKRANAVYEISTHTLTWSVTLLLRGS